MNECRQRTRVTEATVCRNSQFRGPGVGERRLTPWRLRGWAPRGLVVMARRNALLFASVVVVVLTATSAAALVYIMPTDESMVDRTPIVVFGEVLSTRPGPYENSPTTDSLLAIEEVLKGFVAGSRIMIRQPGGVGADEAVATVAGLPMLAEGDRVLLFLREEEEGAHRIVDYALGMFFEARVGDRLLLLREPSLQGEVVLPGGLTGSDRVRSRGYRDAVGFRRWIADRAAGSERPSDYFAPDLREGPVAVASPYRLTMGGRACGTTRPVRWCYGGS